MNRQIGNRINKSTTGRKKPSLKQVRKKGTMVETKTQQQKMKKRVKFNRLRKEVQKKLNRGCRYLCYLL